MPSITLPAPSTEGRTAVERALGRRRSIRSFEPDPLALEDLSQLLWAAQGITDEEGRRTAPSAGATYPLEIYVVATGVTGLEPGVYRYLIESHRLESLTAGDCQRELIAATWGQDWMESTPAALVVTGVVDRTATRYGSRARRYVLMEVGCVVENVHLQALAIGLGTTFVGAFSDQAVADLLNFASGEEPFAILPVGHPHTYR